MSFLGSILGAIFSGFDSNAEWHCDNCGAYMNTQAGFTTETEEWTCTECGFVNDVSEDNILDEDDEFCEGSSDDDDESYENSFDDDDDYDDDDGERISADEAGDIYRCSGCDEDYMFGYSDDELNDPSNK